MERPAVRVRRVVGKLHQKIHVPGAQVGRVIHAVPIRKVQQPGIGPAIERPNHDPFVQQVASLHLLNRNGNPEAAGNLQVLEQGVGASMPVGRGGGGLAQGAVASQARTLDRFDGEGRRHRDQGGNLAAPQNQRRQLRGQGLPALGGEQDQCNVPTRAGIVSGA